MQRFKRYLRPTFWIPCAITTVMALPVWVFIWIMLASDILQKYFGGVPIAAQIIDILSRALLAAMIVQGIEVYMFFIAAPAAILTALWHRTMHYEDGAFYRNFPFYYSLLFFVGELALLVLGWIFKMLA